jgi:CRP/FNR family cyclic AMP-dependent transcriptional regulator
MSPASPEAHATVNEFLGHCHRRQYAPKATIVRQGERAGELFFIVSGTVTVLLEDDGGHDIVLAYLNPGDFFGEVGLVSGEARRSAVVRAKTRCEVAQIAYARLKALTALYPRLLELMMGQLARRLCATNRKLGDLAFTDVYGRVARTLLELSRQPDAGAHPLGTELRITRQELARLVGCSREMVGKVFKAMEARSQISTQGRRVVLHDVRPGQARRTGGSTAD